MRRRYGERHHRRSIRLRGYDYARVGAYFVTICTRERECLFGKIVDGQMRWNEYGQVVGECWTWLAQQYPYVELDERVIMPNHLHGIIAIVDSVGARHAVPLHRAFGRPISGSLPTIVGSFKSAAAKRINALRNAPGLPVWQRNYYERVIRNEEELDRIRRYIAENPARWAEDRTEPRQSLRSKVHEAVVGAVRERAPTSAEPTRGWGVPCPRLGTAPTSAGAFFKPPPPSLNP